MKRIAFGVILFAATIGIAGSARAECSVIIATTPSGATFPCTICIEGGRPVSAICTPTPTGK